MNTLRPFFLLLGRASVFWLSAIALFSVSLFIAGMAEPDAGLGTRFDAILAATVAFPLVAGWIAGALIQEFQHTTFALQLPGVRKRMAAGFLATGFLVTILVIFGIVLHGAYPLNLLLLFVVGLGSYGLGGVFVDPFSVWITTLNVALVLFVIVRSRDIARLAGEHPWIAVAVSLGVGAWGLLRMSARSTFRRKPFRPTSPFPGRFSLEKTDRYERRRRADLGAKRRGWHSAYLGNRPWRWVRAAFHEVHGAGNWKTMGRRASRAWGIPLLFVIHAWMDRGEMDFGKALAWTFSDALLRSPHQTPLGEHGSPYALVIIVLAAAGALTALFRPVALVAGLAYPLSRQQRARVMFRGGLVDAAIFLLIVGPCLLAVGYLTGWLAGHDVRFDYMPYVLRVLLVTSILLPLVYRGRLGLLAATRRKAENTMLGVIFGVAGFVVVAALGTALCAAFTSPLTELIVLSAALLGSRLLYRGFLTNHYRMADLA